jgi:pimeloyl-ACP methyl ester carboxylesterase
MKSRSEGRHPRVGNRPATVTQICHTAEEKWQEYFRQHQPPMLIVWGKNDQIFPAAGAEPYKRDLKTLEYHLLDAGHFALETDGDAIAKLRREFLGKYVTGK